MFQHALAHRALVAGFIEEGTWIIDSLASDALELERVKRAIHTLKGNALSFGLRRVGEFCHRVETALAEGLGVSKIEEIEALRATWWRVAQDVEKWFGGTLRERTYELSADRHRRMLDAAREGD